MFNNDKGFTLVEFVIVMAIIGIMVLMAAPKFMNYVKRAHEAKLQNDIKVVESTLFTKIVDNKMQGKNSVDGLVNAEGQILDTVMKDVNTKLDKEQFFYNIDTDRVEYRGESNISDNKPENDGSTTDPKEEDKESLPSKIDEKEAYDALEKRLNRFFNEEGITLSVGWGAPNNSNSYVKDITGWDLAYVNKINPSNKYDIINLSNIDNILLDVDRYEINDFDFSDKMWEDYTRKLVEEDKYIAVLPIKHTDLVKNKDKFNHFRTAMDINFKRPDIKLMVVTDKEDEAIKKELKTLDIYVVDLIQEEGYNGNNIQIFTDAMFKIINSAEGSDY